ncbi:MAG: response regulator transcription factor [Actinomycetota bacterium]|nr:response regulator transcription factor [Actinomycetota bacterium]
MRLLVVEDDTRMASMLRRGLVEDGYAVDVTGDGIEALWRAGETEYDAVVLDLMLPGIDGFEVCRRLREAEHWSPVLMLTARTDVGDRVRGLDSGADDYLAKPFSFAELSARIRALVRRGAPARPAVLMAGSLRLDPAAHAAWRGYELLDLSAKEFALLALFLRRLDEVLSRTEILDHVWDFAYDRASNVVDQYVGYLRRKIDRPFGLEQLETVRGAGYRLRAEPHDPDGSDALYETAAE